MSTGTGTVMMIILLFQSSKLFDEYRNKRWEYYCFRVPNCLMSSGTKDDNITVSEFQTV